MKLTLWLFRLVRIFQHAHAERNRIKSHLPGGAAWGNAEEKNDRTSMKQIT